MAVGFVVGPKHAGRLQLAGEKTRRRGAPHNVHGNGRVVVVPHAAEHESRPASASARAVGGRTRPALELGRPRPAALARAGGGVLKRFEKTPRTSCPASARVGRPWGLAQSPPGPGRRGTTPRGEGGWARSSGVVGCHGADSRTQASQGVTARRPRRTTSPVLAQRCLSTRLMNPRPTGPRRRNANTSVGDSSRTAARAFAEQRGGRRQFIDLHEPAQGRAEKWRDAPGMSGRAPPTPGRRARLVVAMRTWEKLVVGPARREWSRDHWPGGERGHSRRGGVFAGDGGGQVSLENEGAFGFSPRGVNLGMCPWPPNPGKNRPFAASKRLCARRKYAQAPIPTIFFREEREFAPCPRGRNRVRRFGARVRVSA